MRYKKRYMSHNKLDYRKLLKQEVLYEVIITTFSFEKENDITIPNASCMGIMLNKKNKIQISPFHNTTTYRNLKANGYITINFTDDMYLYALAALKFPDTSIKVPLDFYLYASIKKRGRKGFHTFSELKNSWGFLRGKVSNEVQIVNKDKYGESLRSTFELKLIDSQLFRNCFKLFNRAENLTLEAIILATKLKVARESNNKTLFSELQEQILGIIGKVRRFGKNPNALYALNLVEKYVDAMKF